MKKITSFIITALLLLSGFSAHAQFIPASGVSVALSPKFPKPSESVTVSVESFSTDLNQAMIGWTVNGALQKKGAGLKSFIIEAGAFGSITSVDIRIDTLDLGPVTKKILIIPGNIDIFEQADSFTPPFYKGKGLTPTESTVTLTAKPNLINQSGRKLGNDEIVFTWRKSGRVLGNDSGVGKNTLSIQAGRIPQEVISIGLEAKSISGETTVSQDYLFSSHSPEIIFYENSPLKGVDLDKALTSPFNLKSDEVELVAIPYFFEKSLVERSETSYSWRINNVTVSGTDNQRNVLTLRKPTVSGSSDISLSIENVSRLFAQVSKSLRITFQNQ